MTTAASWEEVGTVGAAATDSSASTEIDPLAERRERFGAQAVEPDFGCLLA
jgi:hypothetical protein